MLRLCADKTLEAHLEALRSGSAPAPAGRQEGVLIGSYSGRSLRVAAFLPRERRAPTVRMRAPSRLLPGGLSALGFTALVRRSRMTRRASRGFAVVVV